MCGSDMFRPILMELWGAVQEPDDTNRRHSVVDIFFYGRIA